MGVTAGITIICIDCGKVVENAGIARKRCSECAKMSVRRQQAESRMRARNRALLGIELPKTQLDREGCKGCFYFTGEFENNKTCNYIFVTGHKRPCPPGKQCTVKKTGERK